LRSLPAFKVARDIPEQLQALICQLEAREAQHEEAPER
jgi:hypothetical protein